MARHKNNNGETPLLVMVRNAANSEPTSSDLYFTLRMCQFLVRSGACMDDNPRDTFEVASAFLKIHNLAEQRDIQQRASDLAKEAQSIVDQRLLDSQSERAGEHGTPRPRF